jgi:hypothetical protein
MPGPRSAPLGGKTKKDHLTGKWARHLRNQMRRADWNKTYQGRAKGGNTTEIPYPQIGTV